MPIQSVPCYSNTDCNAMPVVQGPSYCSSNDTKFLTPGACVSDVSLGYLTPYYQCIATYCSSAYNQTYQNCVINYCTPQFVKSACSSFCSYRPDQRYNQGYGDNIFDCQALTITKISSTTCTVQQQFINCVVSAGFINHFNLFYFLLSVPCISLNLLMVDLMVIAELVAGV